MPNQFDPEKHHRRSIRLKGFDYGQPGAYFVTICAQNRECHFGAVADGQIRLNEAGQIIQAAWGELPSRFSNIAVDAFVVMPNHIHGIVLVGAQFIAPSDPQGKNLGAMNRAPTLGEMVRSFKATSTRLIRGTGNANFAWQRNYYEHVIRDEDSLERIRNYITENPTRWDMDRENPLATTPEPENAWRKCRG